MPSNSAEYMREYRKKRKTLRNELADQLDLDPTAVDRIAELEEEVRHLKAELAKRPITGHSYSSRPFTPVPKKET